MLSCKEAAALSSKQSFAPLSTLERIQFKLHTSVCSACKAFDQQNRFLDRGIERALSEQRKKSLHLTEKQKTDIVEALKK